MAVSCFGQVGSPSVVMWLAQPLPPQGLYCLPDESGLHIVLLLTEFYFAPLE